MPTKKKAVKKQTVVKKDRQDDGHQSEDDWDEDGWFAGNNNDDDDNEDWNQRPMQTTRYAPRQIFAQQSFPQRPSLNRNSVASLFGDRHIGRGYGDRVGLSEMFEQAQYNIPQNSQTNDILPPVTSLPPTQKVPSLPSFLPNKQEAVLVAAPPKVVEEVTNVVLGNPEVVEEVIRLAEKPQGMLPDLTDVLQTTKEVSQNMGFDVGVTQRVAAQALESITNELKIDTSQVLAGIVQNIAGVSDPRKLTIELNTLESAYMTKVNMEPAQYTKVFNDILGVVSTNTEDMAIKKMQDYLTNLNRNDQWNILLQLAMDLREKVVESFHSPNKVNNPDAQKNTLTAAMADVAKRNGTDTATIVDEAQKGNTEVIDTIEDTVRQAGMNANMPQNTANSFASKVVGQIVPTVEAPEQPSYFVPLAPPQPVAQSQASTSGSQSFLSRPSSAEAFVKGKEMLKKSPNQ